jgi:RimJ/RimL family protein N-acetyltransferase
MQLIPFSSEHFGILAPWFASEADVVQWGGPLVHFPLNSSQMQAMLDEGLSDPPRRLCWMAEQDGKIVGHVQISFDWRNGNARFGRVAINPVMRGQSLAVPMLKLAMEKAFSYPQIARLELSVYNFNQPAIKTYARLGFAHEGTMRSNTLVGEERWDSVMMAVLRNEFQPTGS